MSDEYRETFTDSFAERATAFHNLALETAAMKDPEVRALSIRMLERLIFSIELPKLDTASVTVFNRKGVDAPEG